MACQSYGYKLHVQRTNLYGDTVYRGWMYWEHQCTYEDMYIQRAHLMYRGPILWGYDACTKDQSILWVYKGPTLHVRSWGYKRPITYGVQWTTRCMYRGPICMYGDTMCIYYAQSINVWVGTMYVHRTMQSYRDKMHVHRVNPMWTSGNCRKIHAIKMSQNWTCTTKECFYWGPHNAKECSCVRNNNRPSVKCRSTCSWGAWQEEDETRRRYGKYESSITRLEKSYASA